MYQYVYVPIKNLHIKIAGYGMNGPKFQFRLDLMTQLLLLPRYWLPHSNQIPFAVGVWRYIMTRGTCNSYSIILEHNSTHTLALDE